MFQHQPGLQRHSDRGNVWLVTLIDRLEQTSRPDIRAVPCDAAIVAAFRIHLAQPLPLDNRGARGRYLN
jgi:hypothetical protein